MFTDKVQEQALKTPNTGMNRGSQDAPNTPYSLPSFSSTDEERHYMKVRMAAAFRIFAKLGFGEGIAGHITFRDPTDPVKL